MEELTEEEKLFLNKLMKYFADAADGIEPTGDKRHRFVQKANIILVGIVKKIYPKAN